MLVLLCAFILTACSSTPGYNEQLESWVGVSEEHLVDNWGMPEYLLCSTLHLHRYAKFLVVQENMDEHFQFQVPGS